MYDRYTGMWMPDPQQNMRPYAYPRYDITEVNGKRGAEALSLGANGKALVLDQTEPVCYIVTSDGAAVNTVQIFDLVPHVDPQQQQAINMEQRISELTEKISRLEEVLNESLTRSTDGRKHSAQRSNAHSTANAEGSDTADGSGLSLPAAGV